MRILYFSIISSVLILLSLFQAQAAKPTCADLVRIQYYEMPPVALEQLKKTIRDTRQLETLVDVRVALRDLELSFLSISQGGPSFHRDFKYAFRALDYFASLSGMGVESFLPMELLRNRAIAMSGLPETNAELYRANSELFDWMRDNGWLFTRSGKGKLNRPSQLDQLIRAIEADQKEFAHSAYDLGLRYTSGL